jgi:integrase
MSDVAIAKTVRRYGGDYTIHGFRSTFRDWCAESEDHDDLAAEISLAHMDKDKVRAAYLRSDLFDKRRKLMSDWGKFVTGSAK